MQVIHNENKQRFEIEVEGQLAVADYELDGTTAVFTHTEVPTTLRGRGIGEKLVRAALNHVRDVHWRVVPACSFVAAFLKRHPEYQSLKTEA